METKQYKETEEIELKDLIDRIIDENNFMTLLTQDQEALYVKQLVMELIL